MKLLNKTQSKHSILSKRGVDKQMFLSDVYKKRTQAKKHQLDVSQFGRSMVEMLGVLAIIGVLSVGGIAGYSKAMMKHKINNTLDELSRNIAVIVEAGVSNRSITTNQLNIFGGQCNMNSIVNRCSTPFGAYILFYNVNNDSTALSAFEIELEKGSASAEFCTAFYTSGIYNNVPEEWWYQGGYIITDSEWVYGKHEAVTRRGAKPELNAEDISRACSNCKSSGCYMHWNIREF